MYTIILLAALSPDPAQNYWATCCGGLNDKQAQMVVFGRVNQIDGDKAITVWDLRKTAIIAYAGWHKANSKLKVKDQAKPSKMENIGGYLTSTNPAMVLMAEKETTARVVNNWTGVRSSVSIASWTGLEENPAAVNPFTAEKNLPINPVYPVTVNPLTVGSTVPVEPDISARMVGK